MLQEIIKQANKRFDDRFYYMLNFLELNFEISERDNVEIFLSQEIEKAVREAFNKTKLEEKYNDIVNTGNTYNQGKKEGYSLAIKEIQKKQDEFLNNLK